jgi:transmembrane sensor
MEKKREYTIPKSDDHSDYRFPEIDLQYPVSKEEIWNRISAQIDSDQPHAEKKYLFVNYKIALAASILILIGITSFLRFHTITTQCPKGQHLTVLLPDDSKIELNAESSIKYHPYWMKFDREVHLKGEAYFEVSHGKRFRVVSKNGITEVLGTTFNVYARDENYNVSCFTGTVKVISTVNKESVILHASQEAVIQPDGSVKFIQPARIDSNKAWTKNMFFFTAEPIKNVIREIERQYNIRIITRENYNLTYTGNFSKSISEKEVLDLVCTSLELKFEAKSKGEYLIYKN